MISLQDFCNTCDEALDIYSFTDFCPNGLQVEGKKQVRRFATAVTASLATIEKAVEWGADLLLVHHGLFWNRDSYVISGVKRKKIAALMSNNISLLAYHLPLDAHREWGNNWATAHDLGWQNLKPFGKDQGEQIGVWGTFPEMSVEAFCRQLEEYYDHKAHFALGGREMIQSAALISGGAHREISLAAKEGVDAFITGSFDEPVWHIAHEEGLHFFALGHSNTEKVGVQKLGTFLAGHFGIETTFLDVPNPF